MKLRLFLLLIFITSLGHAHARMALADLWPKHSPKASLVTMEELNRAYDLISNRENIPWDYLLDGCHHRAHKAAWILEQAGFITIKVFAKGNLAVITDQSENGIEDWGFHVAIALVSKKDGKFISYILDPSFFDRLVTQKEWISAFDLNGFSEVEFSYFDRFVLKEPQNQEEAHIDWNQNELDTTNECIKFYFSELDKLPINN